MKPDKGGLGAVNLETYATSLRCSWYKRINKGLWSDIILDKVTKIEKVCFLKEIDIHPMHIAVRPIVKAWETLQNAYVEDKEPAKNLRRPLNYFKAWKVGNTYQLINKTNCKFLYNKHGICEITILDLTNEGTIMATPKLKTNIELAEMLGIRDLPFYERITILTKVKAIWKKMTSDFSFKSEQKYTSLKEVFDNTKKGSRNYKAILMSAVNAKNQPAETINSKWRISEKYDK